MARLPAEVAPRRIELSPGRPALYARLEGQPGEKAIVLLHHMDVVAPGPGWRHDPFAGTIAGGFLAGRGALDDKSLGIAHLEALAALARGKTRPRHSVVFLATPDEETGSSKGMGALLQRYPDLLGDAGLILTEGGVNEVVTGSLRVRGVEVAQKHPLWLRLSASGSAGHGALPASGHAAARLTRALARLLDRFAAQPWVATEEVAVYLREAGSRKPGRRGEVMREVAKYAGDPRARAELPASAAALLQNTLAVTRLLSGEETNMIAASAWAELDIRLRSDTTTASALDAVRAGLGDPGIEIEVLLAEETSPAAPRGAAYAALVTQLLRRSPEAPVLPLVASGMTDARFFRRRGIPAYGYSPFAVAFYHADGIHGPDERIEVSVFERGVGEMIAVVRGLADAAW